MTRNLLFYFSYFDMCKKRCNHKTGQKYFKAVFSAFEIRAPCFARPKNHVIWLCDVKLCIVHVLHPTWTILYGESVEWKEKQSEKKRKVAPNETTSKKSKHTHMIITIDPEKNIQDTCIQTYKTDIFDQIFFFCVGECFSRYIVYNKLFRKTVRK